MKTLYSLIFVFFLLVMSLQGQTKVNIGVEGGLALPTGSTADKYGVGFGGGLFGIIPTPVPMLGVVIGADYLYMPGKSTTETRSFSTPYSYGTETTTTIYHSLQVGTLYAGPKIGGSSGAYFLPSLSLNIASEIRIGFYLGGGVLIPLQAVNLHLGARFGILNLLLTDSNEDTSSGIGIFAGIVF